MANDIAISLVDILFKASIQLAVLAFIVSIITRVFHRAPASVRYALWMLVLIKVFIPPVIQLPSEFGFWQMTAKPGDAAVMSVHTNKAATSKHSNDSVLTADKPTVGEYAAKLLSTPSARTFICHFWILGASLMCLLLSARRLYQSRLMRRLYPADPRLSDILAECAANIGVHRLPKIGLSERVPTPMLVGTAHPVILLPFDIGQSCSESDLRAMFLHELAHMKRRDMVGVWLYQFAQALFFFHPAIWIAGRQLEKEREIACDELVLSSSAITRKAYASGYLSAVKLANGMQDLSPALAMAESPEVEAHRLKMILRSAVPPFTRGWMLAFIVVAVVGLPSFSGVRPTGRPAEVSQPGIRSMVSSDTAIKTGRAYLEGLHANPGELISTQIQRVQPSYAMSPSIQRSAWVVKFRARRHTAEAWVDTENGNIIGSNTSLGEE